MTKNAILCFVIKNNRALLIRKKRGFGKGKIVAPGGRIKRGESPEDAAIREVFEETGIKPVKPEKYGEIHFYFGGKKEWFVHVLKTDNFKGTEKETKEAIPYWHNINNLPYEEMWIDDIHWVPLMLEGKKFSAKFFFDKDVKNILNYEIVEDGPVV